MFVLGLQGSPRLKGNTSILLSTFLNEAERLGAYTRQIDVASMDIVPCQECGICERDGYCPINDDMQQIYPLLRSADLIVMATPIFFYGATAQMKALIDRSQAMWVRRYVHRLTDPGRKWRKGLMLSLGATKGKRLFDGLNLMAKYFFDAVGAHFEDSLTYRQIEKSGEIRQHPKALIEAREKARDLVMPYLHKVRVFFVCSRDPCPCQMASAFTQFYAGDRIETECIADVSGGINPLMSEVMRERGIDMGYRESRSIDEAVHYRPPDLVISMGHRKDRPIFPWIESREWPVPDSMNRSIEAMCQMRDKIEERVRVFINSLERSKGSVIEDRD